MVATGEEAGKEPLLWAPTSLFLLQTPLPATEVHSQRPPAEWALGACFPRKRTSHLGPLIPVKVLCVTELPTEPRRHQRSQASLKAAGRSTRGGVCVCTCVRTCADAGLFG